MKHKRISVIIPVYNAENYLEQCLDSIVNQTIGMDNIELVLVDDASTDLSLKILKKYAGKFPNDIMLIALNENRGQANARNIGIHQATAQYLTFLDADDWVDIDIYEKMLEPADRYQCELIQCFRADHIEGKMPYHGEEQQSTGVYKIRSAEERKNFFRSLNWGGV